MKKMITLLLALIMVLSLIPVSAMALTLPIRPLPPLPDNFEPAPELPKDIQDQINQDKYGDLTPIGTISKPKDRHNSPDDHEYGYASNTKYHWFECPCGCQISMEPHVDPKDAVNDYCICGYHFSSNADLVTLWVDGCPPIKDFNKNVTEYKLNAYTYKDVKSIKISTNTFDSEATVELPEDLTLKAGENKFDVKVTSENQKVTKTYTLIITK